MTLLSRGFFNELHPSFKNLYKNVQQIVKQNTETIFKSISEHVNLSLLKTFHSSLEQHLRTEKSGAILNTIAVFDVPQVLFD